MVVKVAEYTGTLNCKNCVIIPYSSRLQSQSNINNNNININEKNTKQNISHCASQTVSSSLFNQHENDTKNEILWHKQFARWWSWNWQRKRTSILKKLRKNNQYLCQTSNNTKKTILTKNKSVECNLTSKEKIDTTISNLNSSKNGRLHQMYDYEYEKNEPINEFIPVFTKCSSRNNDVKNQPYKSSSRRNKQKERVYEGWMREITSDTESETDVVVKGESRKHKNRMHYLSLRLRKLNSQSKIDLCDKKSQKNNEKVTEYKSPITGKTYDLSLLKTNECYEKPTETCPFNTDNKFLAKPEFECTKDYYKIRNEHLDLLNSICKIVKHKQTDENFADTYYVCSDAYMPDVSRSLPIFMERNPPELPDTTKYERHSDEIFLSNSRYDINYLYNNLEVFKSSITETSFIWDYLLKAK